MTELREKSCQPCEKGTPALTESETEQYLDQLEDWNLLDNNKKIERVFKFNNFVSALKFVNSVGEVAEQENHHPDILIFGYNKVKITLYTHVIGGLSLNDFIVASKIDGV